MKIQSVVALLSVIVLIVGATGGAVAQPANSQGPPDETPSVVPDFVSNLLDSISTFITSVLDTVGALVEGVAPENVSADLVREPDVANRIDNMRLNR